MDINSVVITGRITRDVELTTAQSGVVYTNFDIAVDNNRKDGEQKKADFIKCKAYGKTAESIGTYVKKGNLLVVNGQLRCDTYKNQNGTTVNNTYINVVTYRTLSYNKSENESGKVSTTYADSSDYASQYTGALDINESDLPF